MPTSVLDTRSINTKYAIQQRRKKVYVTNYKEYKTENLGKELKSKRYKEIK